MWCYQQELYLASYVVLSLAGGLGLVSGSSCVGGIMCVVAITKRAQFPISS